jgi:hypothetical protein
MVLQCRKKHSSSEHWQRQINCQSITARENAVFMMDNAGLYRYIESSQSTYMFPRVVVYFTLYIYSIISFIRRSFIRPSALTGHFREVKPPQAYFSSFVQNCVTSALYHPADAELVGTTKGTLCVHISQPCWDRMPP